MKKFISLVLLSLFCCGIVWAEKPLRLFHIEKSKNPNIICYDANLDEDGKFDMQNPVDGYWVLRANKNGKMEDLNEWDRKSYGFTTTYNEKNNSFDFSLKSIDRKMTILMVDGKPKLKILINNMDAYLEKIYIQSKENALKAPKMVFYTLYGKTAYTNEPIEEKVIVK